MPRKLPEKFPCGIQYNIMEGLDIIELLYYFQMKKLFYQE
jgi:hypothetical protein